MTEDKGIASVAELLAHAHAMETEAHDRYLDLAGQMEVHNNIEVAELFRKMAEVEAIHVRKILERVGDMELPHISPWEYRWLDEEGAETVPSSEVHYMMTPYHALQLALRAEQRGYDFYAWVLATNHDKAVLELAAELAEEEREHVTLVRRWLARYPKPADDWDEDLDPPMLQE